MKVEDLFEAKGNLVGFEFGGHVADPNKDWPTNFRCVRANLTSLEGAPKRVHGAFQVQNNALTSMKGGPEYVGGDFDVDNNSLTSFEFSPRDIRGDYFCSSNHITSLEGIHKHIDSIDGHFIAGPVSNEHKATITSHVLGLLKIKKLQGVDINNRPVEDILDKYLPEGDIIECQQELIEAGFDDFAKL